MNIVLIRKCIVDTEVVNDVTCTRQSVITRVAIMIFMTRRYPPHKEEGELLPNLYKGTLPIRLP